MARLGRRALVAGAFVVTAAALAGIGAAAERTGPDAHVAPPTPAEVGATQRTLDARAATPGSVPDAVVSWGVDPAVGLVVVGVRGQRDAEVDRFLADIDPRTVRVDEGTPAVRPLPGTS